VAARTGSKRRSRRASPCSRQKPPSKSYGAWTHEEEFVGGSDPRGASKASEQGADCRVHLAAQSQQELRQNEIGRAAFVEIDGHPYPTTAGLEALCTPKVAAE
jgi:hypothetical protein